MKALALEHVSATFAGRKAAALDSVDFEARTGEVHAVLGPNGAGKTTLVRVAAGLTQPAHGTVTVQGDPIQRLRPRERARRIAVVPQGLEALPPNTVATFVAGGRYARSEQEGDVLAVREALTRTGLGGFGDRPLRDLSGGERQRALVARALAQDTPVLLCDEPTASLDVDQQIAVLEILAAESCRGRAVVLVTHELNLASQFADRVTLLHEGRVRARGPADQVLTPEVLAPVYGDGLFYGALPGGSPLVVPRRRGR